VPASERIAYFSMEIALEPSIPTYSGGLGVLAGDTVRSAADLEIPLVAVSLVHRKGYFRQRLDDQGNQFEEPAVWYPEQTLEPVDPTVQVLIEGRRVLIRGWRMAVRGVTGGEVMAILLDTNLPENSPWDRTLTDFLYGGDQHYRLCQEVVLGMGGAKLLERLGYTGIDTYHMNEGHSALLTLELLEREVGSRRLDTATEEQVQAVRRRCVFTTHTPVPAGHDRFPMDLVRHVLGDGLASALEAMQCCPGGSLNMTGLALRFSHYINGVAMHHSEVSHGMFPNYPIAAITNGVHAVTWTAAPFRKLYDEHVPAWRHDNLYLRYAIGIPTAEIRTAHISAKRTLLDEIDRTNAAKLDEAVFTIGFARRATTYKRPDLLFSDLERLRRISKRVGPFQVIYAGKAHPRDEGGREMIRRVFRAAALLKDDIRVFYIPDYDMHWAQLITSGVDLWLNTPHRPYEASGTSGMKAALNGVPSLSVLDGWWIEGCIEGATGWAIGQDSDADDQAAEAASLYDKLEFVILPMFYERPEAFAKVMRLAIAVNGAFFNTQRMLAQYVANAYFPEKLGSATASR
jgi:starch phosphorylase